jgi:hypothetical protein
MSGQQPRIFCNRTMGVAKASASTQAGDWNDVIGHHRYYGSSAISGEPMVEPVVGCARVPSMSSTSDASR